MKWQIGTVSDIDEDEKTRPIGTYRRYRQTERPDELLAMPENTSAVTGTTGTLSQGLPVWALVALAGVTLLSFVLTALALLWVLLV